MPLANLFGRQHHLTLGPAVEHSVILGMAFNPLVSAERVGCAGVERIISDRQVPSFELWIAKHIGPVVDVVDLDAAAWAERRCTSGRAWHRAKNEVSIIRDELLQPHAACFEASREC